LYHISKSTTSRVKIVMLEYVRATCMPPSPTYQWEKLKSYAVDKEMLRTEGNT